MVTLHRGIAHKSTPLYRWTRKGSRPAPVTINRRASRAVGAVVRPWWRFILEAGDIFEQHAAVAIDPP